jgi:hypothetical protein
VSRADLVGQPLRLGAGKPHRLIGNAAKVEHEPDLARDLAGAMQGGIRIELARGDREVVAFGLPGDPRLAQGVHERYRRRHRVAAMRPRHRSGVSVGADRAGVAVAPAAANARDDADRGAAADQHRALLDMHLDIAAKPCGIEVSRASADRFDIAAELRHMLGHAPAGIGPRDQQDFGW